MRYFIHIAYDGSNYSGWQRQKDTTNTVQETIEQILTRIFKQKISTYGCGRTDAGVHANQYIVQINIDEAPLFDLKFILNKNLPNDISVYEIIEVKDDQHCRHSAIARTYDYFIHWNKNPHLIRFSSFYEDLKLDFDVMQKATTLILKTKDFKALCKQPELYKNTLCLVSNCEIFVDEKQGRLRFTITSNRFLRGMVRICVYFLLEVGTGKMTLEEFEAILKQEKEWNENHPAHPNGLFLSGIEYPFLTLADSNNVVKLLSTGLE